MKRFLKYDTEDAKKGLTNIDKNGVMYPEIFTVNFTYVTIDNQGYAVADKTSDEISEAYFNGKQIKACIFFFLDEETFVHMSMTCEGYVEEDYKNIKPIFYYLEASGISNGGIESIHINVMSDKFTCGSVGSSYYGREIWPLGLFKLNAGTEDTTEEILS